MWRIGRATPKRPGRITVAELARGELEQHPGAVAIYWTDTQAVVCRQHATTTEQMQAMTQVRPDTDEATLLTGGKDAARQLRRQCVLCP